MKDDEEILNFLGQGDWKSLGRVLASYEDDEIRLTLGRNLLHEAARLGQGECAAVLLSCGVSVRKRDLDGHDPVWFALRGGFWEVALLLEVMRVREAELGTFRHGKVAWESAAQSLKQR